MKSWVACHLNKWLDLFDYMRKQQGLAPAFVERKNWFAASIKEFYDILISKSAVACEFRVKLLVHIIINTLSLNFLLDIQYDPMFVKFY